MIPLGLQNSANGSWGAAHTRSRFVGSCARAGSLESLTPSKMGTDEPCQAVSGSFASAFFCRICFGLTRLSKKRTDEPFQVTAGSELFRLRGGCVVFERVLSLSEGLLALSHSRRISAVPCFTAVGTRQREWSSHESLLHLHVVL